MLQQKAFKETHEMEVILNEIYFKSRVSCDYDRPQLPPRSVASSSVTSSSARVISFIPRL